MQTKYLQPKKLAVFITLLSIPLLGHADDANNLANAPMYIASDEGSPNIMLTLGKEHTIFNAAYNDYVDLNEDGIIDLMFDPSIQYEGNFDYTLCYKYQRGTTNLVNVSTSEGDFKYLSKVHGDSKSDSDKDEAVGYWYPVANSTKIKISDAVDNWPKGVEKEIAVCNRSGETGTWSGNFLNYLSSSKLDVIRRVFYGGARVYNHVAPTTSSKQVRYKNPSNGDFGVTLLKNSHITRDAHAWGKVFSNEQYLNSEIKITDYTDITVDGTYFFVFATDESDSFNNDKEWWERASGDPDFRFAPGFMRYGKVSNAGIPGSKGLKNEKQKNYYCRFVSCVRLCIDSICIFRNRFP
jgi:type IV pilus assembly protein PilY1